MDADIALHMGGSVPFGGSPPFRHGLLEFDDIRELPRIVVPFIVDGLAAGERAVIEVSEDVRVALSGGVHHSWLPGVGLLGDTFTHPHQALWTLRQLVDEGQRPGEHGIRLVTQIDYEDACDPVDWVRAETVANHVFRDLDVRSLCLYDRSSLNEAILHEAHHCHPTIVDESGPRPNPAYEEPVEHLRALDTGIEASPLEATDPAISMAIFDRSSLARLRALADKMLDSTMLPAHRRADLLDAVFEVSVNALMFGGEHIDVSVWHDDGAILCRVTDDGPGLPDPLTGYAPPDGSDHLSGRGLWSARQLCDRLTTSQGPAGLTARLWICVPGGSAE
jgi:anti-sigma regulatory factor (Ser/Thr protein kinase)